MHILRLFVVVIVLALAPARVSHATGTLGFAGEGYAIRMEVGVYGKPVIAFEEYG